MRSYTLSYLLFHVTRQTWCLKTLEVTPFYNNPGERVVRETCRRLGVGGAKTVRKWEPRRTGEVCRRWKSPPSKLAQETSRLDSLGSGSVFCSICNAFCVQDKRVAITRKGYVSYLKTVKCSFFFPLDDNCSLSQKAGWNPLPTDACRWTRDLYIWKLHCEAMIGENLQESIYALSAKAFSLKAAFGNTFFWKGILTDSVLSIVTLIIQNYGLLWTKTHRY